MESKINELLNLEITKENVQEIDKRTKLLKRFVCRNENNPKRAKKRSWC